MISTMYGVAIITSSVGTIRIIRTMGIQVLEWQDWIYNLLEVNLQ